MDGSEFQDKAKQDDYHFATAGTTAPGRMATNNVVGEYDANGDPKDKGRERHGFADLIQQITDLQIQLSQQVEYFHKVLQHLMDDRALALSSRDALQGFLDKFQKAGEFEMGPDGYPIDPEIRKAIIAHEASSGKTFNPHDADAVTDFVCSAIADIEMDIDGFDVQIHDTTKELEDTLTALNSIDDLKRGTYSPSELQESIREIEANLSLHQDNDRLQTGLEQHQSLNLGLGLPKL